MRLPASELALAIHHCRDSFQSAAIFSLFINLLMLTPSIYMLQVYDRAVGSNSTSTLLMLTLLAVVLFVTLGALEWVRSQILIRVSAHFDLLLNERLYRVLFRQALVSGGKASAQPLSDLLMLRQFLTGIGGAVLTITLDDASVITATNFESFIYDNSTADVDGGVVTVGVIPFDAHNFSG